MRVAMMVRQLMIGCSSVVHEARVAAVSKVVEGIVDGRRLVPATIGRNLKTTARPKHSIKCVDRLLGNSHMATDRMFFFLALAHHLLRGCKRPVILVDWTHTGGTNEALVAAMPIGGRALPIYIEVHPLKKLGNAAVEERFLENLKSIVPSECQGIIVSDAGFKGPFFQAVRKLSWHFVGRVRGTAKAVCSNGKVVSKEDLYQRASTSPKDLGKFALFVKQRLACRLVLIRKRRKPGRKLPPPKNKEEREARQSARDPWLLATSLDNETADHVVSLYAKRMQIEETFRDAKNHRFGWCLGTVTLSTPQRMATLLLLAALALAVVTLIGMSAERRGLHRGYQANTEKQRTLSFFVLACAIISRSELDCLSSADFAQSLAAIARLVTA